MAAESQWPPVDPDKTCDKCGAPASWADEWTSNLTYHDSLLYHCNKYIASPRVWPIGYIVLSPYSPLAVERQIPDRNWRDAFEDLLALDSGGQMIDPESRRKEAVTAERLWRDRTTESITVINKQLEYDGKYMALLKKIRAAYASTKSLDTVKSIDDKEISPLAEQSHTSVTSGEKMIAMLKDPKYKDYPASKHKRRGQWIASLISSGALNGWESDLWDSAKGDYINFRKSELLEDGGYDGVTVLESELFDYYENNKPMQFQVPLWTTSRLEYPPSFGYEHREPETSINNDQDFTERGTRSYAYSVKPTSIMPTSILAQSMRAERTLLRGGTMSVKVFLQNFHTNGKKVDKEITDDACKVLEEGEIVRNSMIAMFNAVAFASQDQTYAKDEQHLKDFEEDLD